MQLWIIGLFCVSALWSYVPEVETSPLGEPPSASGFASYRQRVEQTAGFAEGFRGWFKSVKNFFNRGSDPQALPPTGAARLIMELENEDPLERQRNKPGGFFLDLSTLTFNPDRDWGFRLGQWYFIRKTNDETSPNNWKSSNIPEWPAMGDTESVNILPSTTTMKSNPTTIITSSSPARELTIIPESTTPAIKMTTTTEFTTSTARKDTENETFSSSESSKSAEVLGPSG